MLYLDLLENPGLLLQLQHLPLLCKHLTAHLQNHLKSFSSFNGVLLEPLNGELLDRVLYFLPASTKSGDLSMLVHVGLGCRGESRWLIDDRFANRKQVRHGHIHGAHGDLLCFGVDIGCLIYKGCVLASKELGDPFRCRLPTGDETLCPKLR